MVRFLILFMFLGHLGCTTPRDAADRQHEIHMFEKAQNSKQCRIACDNAMKSFNPLTGECKCYPPEHLFDRRRR
jgi:hypothetical protein